MQLRNRMIAGALLASTTLLSGCVAAAIPLVAGGALVGKDRFDGKDDAAEIDEKAPGIAGLPDNAPPAAESEDAPARQAVIESGRDKGIGEGQTAPGPGRPALLASTDANEPSPPEGSPELTPTPQAEPTGASGAPVMAVDYRAYDSLYSFVDAQSRRDPVQAERQSALLAAPGTLSPQRTDCSIRPPAVLLDLDPSGQTFDPTVQNIADPALPRMLSAMRQQEIEIFWISDIPAVQAGAVRETLRSSGLDEPGRDQLLLKRRAGDRKQEQRKELGETHCLLAIAGDTRADFDELYLYLKDQDAAQPLEELVGAGWFIAPLPLTGE